MRRSSALLLGLSLAIAVASVFAADARIEWDTALAQWRELPAAERTSIDERMQAWDAMSRQQRSVSRERWLAWRELDEAQRNRIRAASRAFNALPPQEQIRLRQLFESQDLLRQRGWRLGPELGADWPRLQPLFGYVPAEQRAPLMHLLRQLDASQRDDLAALAQRVPPQSREAFRRELLQVAPAQRAEWLHRRREQ